jgi:uncharacterized protein (TIGR02266 family)
MAAISFSGRDVRSPIPKGPMSPDPDAPPDSQPKVDLERQRVPLERKISLKFKEFRGFITEYSDNLSLGGMFIRTTSPKPAGTIFDFELSLTDDFKLVQGIGEVVWVRDQDAGPERPAGMGVRFLDLSPESRKLIERIVDEHVEHGGTPFELEVPQFPPPVRPAQAPPGGAAPRPAAPAPGTPVFHATAAPMTAPPPVGPSPTDATRRLPVGAGGHPPAGTPPPRPTPPMPRLVPASPPPSATRQPEQRPLWEQEPPAAAARPAGPLAPARPAPVAPPEPGEEVDPFAGLEDLGSPDLGLSDLGLTDLDSPLLAASATELLPAGSEWSDAAEVEAFPVLDDEPALDIGAPSSPPSAAHLPAGFDEVARVFAPIEPAQPAKAPDSRPLAGEAPRPPRPQGAPAGPTVAPLRASDLLNDETVRLSRPRDTSSLAAAPAAVTASPLSQLLDMKEEPGAPVAPITPPLAYAKPSPRPAPPRRRRSPMPLVFGVLLVALAGGAAALYFGFPHLLPSWVPGSQAPPVAARSEEGPATSDPRGSAEVAPDTSTGAPSTDGGAAPPQTAGEPGQPQAIPPPASAFPVLPPAAPGREAGPGQAGRVAGALAPTGPFETIDEIWGQRTAAGTVVTLVADGTVPESAFTTFRLEGANPREVLRLVGVASGFSRPVVPVGTAEVKQVRVGFHSKPEGNELHVVIDLASPRIQLMRVVASDNRIELLFAPQ